MKYPETRIVFQSLNDRTLLRELTSFAGWYTFASVGSMGRGAGNPDDIECVFRSGRECCVRNCQSGQQVDAVFATAILQSIRPQIIKSEGAQDRIRVKKIIACRMSLHCFSLRLVFHSADYRNALRSPLVALGNPA